MLFTVDRPAVRSRPVIVEIPHAGLRIPDDVRAEVLADETDALRDADAFVDEIFAFDGSRGESRIVSHLSRYVVDLNRDVDDVGPDCVVGAKTRNDAGVRGVVWSAATSGRRLIAKPMERDRFERRIDWFYRPYHTALHELITEAKRSHGFAILLAAHSMPSRDRTRDGLIGARRADVVPGTRAGRTADASLIDCVAHHFRSAGMSVRHDEPYRGGATVARWGRPAEGIHAVQIEINRAMYMNEARLERVPARLSFVRDVCARLVQKLCAWEPDRGTR